MQKILAIAALAVFPGTLLGQSLVGTWQGTLQLPNRELRVVLKISTADNDTLKAMFYSIDQGGTAIPASSLVAQGVAMKIALPGIGASYEGKVSADHNSIAGTFTQGLQPLPLNLTRVTTETAWAIPEPPPPPKPMAAGAKAVFEVATIKPAKPEARGKGFVVRGHEFSTINTSLSSLITFAYGIHARQVTGGPSWMETEKFDITARPEGEGMPDAKQLRTMVQKLLADRFQLTFHRDKKELSVYALVAGKSGPKLTPSTGDPNGLPGLFFRKLGVLNVRNGNMADFAEVMQSSVLDRPVVDQTGLSGRFDFALEWTPDEFQFADFGPRPANADNTDSAPDLFTAIQQQLGLKLDAVKAPTEVLVIDHVEKPSEN
jgi:uncharacterized protein (TIGR03435 family)